MLNTGCVCKAIVIMMWEIDSNHASFAYFIVNGSQSKYWPIKLHIWWLMLGAKWPAWVWKLPNLEFLCKAHHLLHDNYRVIVWFRLWCGSWLGTLYWIWFLMLYLMLMYILILSLKYDSLLHLTSYLIFLYIIYMNR